MRLRPRKRRGIKLIEMMVAIFIVAIAFGLFIPFLNQGRVNTHSAQCQNNMRQLGLAMLNFTTTRNDFPNAGTIYDNPSIHGGDPARSNIYRAIADPDSFDDHNHPLFSNWVVDLLPYLDQSDLANAWDRNSPFDWDQPRVAGQPTNGVISKTALSVLRCPDDPTTVQGQGNLSYAVNGGFARWYPIPVSWSGGAKDGTSRNGEVLRLTPDRNWDENMAIGKKLGVMFLGTQTRDQPLDMRTTFSDITDGSSNTLLIAENTLVGFSQDSPYAGGLETNWACPLPNFVFFLGSDDICRSGRSPSDCLGGQLQRLKNGGDGPGWARANPRGTFEEINYGQNLTVEGSFPFANSGHPGGSNFVFCDGAVRFISSTVDGTIYAKLITPGGGKLPGVSPGMFQGPISEDDYTH